MRDNDTLQYRREVIAKYRNSELLAVITAELEDRHNEVLIRLQDVGEREFREWQGRAKSLRELLHYINSCLKINQNDF